MSRLLACFLVLVPGFVGAAEPVPDPQSLLLRAAGFNEDSPYAPHAVFDVRVRENGASSWRVEPGVGILADGSRNVRQSGSHVTYVTCEEVATKVGRKVTHAGETYFAGHRIELRAKQCDQSACDVDVKALLAVDHGRREERSGHCVREIPNLSSHTAHFVRRAPIGQTYKVAMQGGGEMEFTLRAE